MTCNLSSLLASDMVLIVNDLGVIYAELFNTLAKQRVVSSIQCKLFRQHYTWQEYMQ